MDDEDYPMEEDGIVASTELNGSLSADTVAPSDIFSDFIGHPVSNADQLPIHSSPKVIVTPSTMRVKRSSLARPLDGPRRSFSPQVCIPPALPRRKKLPYATSRTGLVYDSRMRFHTELPDLSLKSDEIHPEDPRRIHAIFSEIESAGLVKKHDENNEMQEEYCWRIRARSATRPEILLIHTEEHYDFVKSLQDMSVEDLRKHSESMDSIYFNHSTFECAKLAAGGAIEACKAVVQGAVRNSIAIIRPPGHHAESTQPSGFCIFNNVPIATRVCQNEYPDTCRKVLILDWDVHHGNGIQHAFYDDPNVLYISLHVFRNQQFYPNLPDGNVDFCGEGPGEGKNINIPWAETGMGDAEYIYAFQEVVMPIAAEFDPDLVIVSAGFDAAEGDLLGGCFVTPACYGHMTHMLMRLAKGKIVVCLEGGYNLQSIARSALAVTRVLLLEPPDRLCEDLPTPKDSAIHVIEEVKRQHSHYWKCLYPKHMDKTDPGYGDTYRLNEIIREWQAQRLAHEHAMIPLPLQINKAVLAQTFEHNIIATPNYADRHPLVVIFHDPPNFQDYPDPVTGRRELHNTWLTDVIKKYIDWAISNGFQVIDVNIPKVVSVEEPDIGYVRSDDPEARQQQTRELAGYLWENYIEPNDATQVFFMGVGDAYRGLVDLLSHNENTTDIDSPVQCLIGFVADGSIQSIRRQTDDSIAKWYYDHSRIFVKKSHFAWDPERQRKLRKKNGQLIKSTQDVLDAMLEVHLPEVQKYLLTTKDDYEERLDSVNHEEETPVGLKSPAVLGRPLTPKFGDGGLKSPKMPTLGFFSVTGASPKSPVKRGF